MFNPMYILIVAMVCISTLGAVTDHNGLFELGAFILAVCVGALIGNDAW